MRIERLLVSVALLTLASAACRAASDGTSATATSWSAPNPPSEWASGLTIGEVPPGSTFGWNEGHETATFHVFVGGDGATQFAVGRRLSSEPYPVAGRDVTRGARVFTVMVVAGLDRPGETRILEDAGDGVRIEVVSQSLDEDALLRIAESVDYDPARDR